MPEDWEDSDDEPTWAKSDDEKPEDDDEDDWDKALHTGPTAEELEQQAMAEAARNRPQKMEKEVYVPLDDPVAEKKRQMELQLQADMELGCDLFSGYVVTDGVRTISEAPTSPSKSKKKEETEVDDVIDLFKNMSLDTTKQVEDLMNQVLREEDERGENPILPLGKLSAVEPKAHMKGCLLTFLTKLLALVSDKLNVKDVEELETKIKKVIAERKRDATMKEAAKTKINTVNKNTKFNVNDALDERYGVDDDWDEEDWAEGEWGEGEWVEGEWAEGEWAEGAKTTAKPGAAKRVAAKPVAEKPVAFENTVEPTPAETVAAKK